MEPGEPPAKSRRRAIYWVISLLLAGVLLYFSLRGIEWLRVWTVVRSARLLFVALAIAQVWNSAVYLRALPQALELAGDGPAPVADRNGNAGAVFRYAARAGQTGSW